MTSHDVPLRAAGPRSFEISLLALLFFGILVTIWFRGRWALSLFQAGVFILAAVWIFLALRRAIPIERSLIVYALAIVVAWGVVQLAFDLTIYPWESIQSVLAWTTNLAVCFLALQITSSSRVRQRVLRWMVYFGLAVSVLSTVQAYTSRGEVYWLFPTGYPEVFGPFLSPNQYAAFMESLIPIAVVLAQKHQRHSPVFLTAAAVMTASVIASASRAGTIVVLIEIAVVTLLLARRADIAERKTVLLRSGQLLAIMAIAATVVGWDRVWERLQQADPFAGRRELIQSTQEMIRARPWLGFGLGTWAIAYPAYAVYDDGRFANQAHNDWLQWAAEGGIPFALLLVAVAAWTIRPALRSIWGVGLLAVYGHAWVDYPMQQRPALAAWFFALLGILAASHRAAVAREARSAAAIGTDQLHADR